MINKIRRRFILVAMIAVTIVLTVIISGIFLVSKKNLCNYSDMVLESLAENGGRFPENFRGEGAPNKYLGIGLSSETPFETRYFYVKYDADGNCKSFYLDKIATVNTPAEALAYCDKVFQKKSSSGFVNEFRYLVYDTPDGGKLLLFMDCSKHINTLKTFFRSCLVFSASALAAVFILMLLFSKKAVQPIAKSYEKQRHFITDASHELKTPLTIISANNELIEMDYGENESTRAISKQVERMANMTKNLTVLAKIDERKALEEKKIINVSEITDDVVEPYKNLALTSGKILERHVCSDACIQGDESLIRQMLSLMLDNSVKYGKSYIDVRVSRNNGKFRKGVIIEIENDADKVEQGNLNKYFDRFYRSDDARASGLEGSGIGLSIVREIAELHKGTVAARGEGDKFIVTISFEKSVFAGKNKNNTKPRL